MPPDLPIQNRRIKELVRHFSDGNVAAFSETLDNISYQSLNRIFNIDSRSQKYPGVSSEIIKAITTRYPNINIDWLLHGKGSMLKVGEEGISVLSKNFTPDQLFAMFLEVTKAQTTILNNIESNMARENTLADVGTNLNFVVASVKKISKIQDSGLKDLQGRLSAVQASQTDLSRDVHSKLDQSDEDGKKQGNHP